MDTRTVDDLMHQEVQHLTTQGMPQSGIVFVCQTHGVRPFHALAHPMPGIQAPGIVLGCGCAFEVAPSGAVRQSNVGSDGA